jgi:hypothetical protein
MLPALPQIGAARARLLLAVGALVSCTFLALGILAMLRTGARGLGSDHAVPFAIFTVHPLTAIIWTALGVVGVAMSAVPRGAQLYLAWAGALLVVWGLLGLLLDGEPSKVFVRDMSMVTLHLVAGGIALVAAWAPLPERVPGVTPDGGGSPDGS